MDCTLITDKPKNLAGSSKTMNWDMSMTYYTEINFLTRKTVCKKLWNLKILH